MQSMCPICRHSQRTLIDERLRAGHHLRVIANEFGVLHVQQLSVSTVNQSMQAILNEVRFKPFNIRLSRLPARSAIRRLPSAAQPPFAGETLVYINRLSPGGL